MKKYLLLLLLSACSHSHQIVTPVAIDVPVAIECAETIPLAPVSEFDALPDNSSLRLQTLALISDVESGRQYARELTAILKACHE